MEKLTAKFKILIYAKPERVWETLITPLSIRQWDELPDDFDDRQRLLLGTNIRWKHDEERYSQLTVTVFEPNHLLRMNLYNSWWPNPEASYTIRYSYQLSEKEEGTELTITIGDFSVLDEGESYYNASMDFVTVASAKIKKLAEQEPDFV